MDEKKKQASGPVKWILIGISAIFLFLARSVASSPESGMATGSGAGGKGVGFGEENREVIFLSPASLFFMPQVYIRNMILLGRELPVSEV